MIKKIKKIFKMSTKSVHSDLISSDASAELNVNPSKERDSKFYDDAYSKQGNYQEHYTKSVYFFIWSVIIDRIRSSGVSDVLDLGCGPGQFAQMLYESNLDLNYSGLDFSKVAIEDARKICGSYVFDVRDLNDTSCFSNYNYDCIVSLEFFEHINSDLDVIRSIKSGTLSFITVPNFDSKGHVRYFDSESSVSCRYADYFDTFNVTFHKYNNKGAGFYLIEGVTR